MSVCLSQMDVYNKMSGISVTGKGSSEWNPTEEAVEERKQTKPTLSSGL